MWGVHPCCRGLGQGCIWCKQGSSAHARNRKGTSSPDFHFCFLCPHAATTHGLCHWKFQEWEGQGAEFLWSNHPIGKTFGIWLAHVKLQIAMINRIQTPRERKKCRKGDGVCPNSPLFSKSEEGGSCFEISILYVMKRFLSLVPPSLSYLSADRAA